MTAQPGITTSSSPPNTVVQVQAGMSVQPVVLVDKDGNYVTPATAATALATTTTPVNVSAAAAPTSGQVLTATSGTAATWQVVPTNVLTTLGDTIAENSVPTAVRVAGNTTATKNFYTQTGTGSASALPVWGTIAAADLPTGTTSTKGALQLDGTASDIQPVGTAAAAGAVGKTADAGHVHAGLALLATTGITGYAKVNGTGNILTWTAPNDGAMHRVFLVAVERVTSTETGGTMTVTPGFPDGTTATAKTLFNGGASAGYLYSTVASCPQSYLLGPNTAIVVAQQSTLTGGAATVWVELWGS